MKKFLTFFMPLALVSCIVEDERLVGGGGVNPPDKSDKTITISIPGGFSVMSTRGLEAEEEVAIDDLWMLAFSGGGVLESIEEIAPEDIYPTADPNRHTLRIALPAGNHRVVMLANAADLNAAPGVRVGNTLWAVANVAEPGTFADTPYRYDPKSGVRNHRYTWTEITGGVSDQTTPGYCPPDWRLPTRAEYQALIDASSSTVLNKSYTDPTDGTTVWGHEFTITATGEKLFFSNSNYNGGLGAQNAYGTYWSSTSASSSTAYLLAFQAGTYINANHANIKSTLQSVRCVRGAPGTRASTRAGVGDISVGQTYADVMAALVGEPDGKMYEYGGAIAMWGESNVAFGDGATPNVEIHLHRAIARIDVGEGAWDEDTGWAGLSNFEITSVTVVGANDRYSLIPASLDADGVPNAPDIPAGATAFTVEDSETLFTFASASGAPITNKIYIPEAEIASVAFEDRMALVVGGRYLTDADPKYYRVEFRNADGDLVDVVRNHLYRFAITAVNGPGSEDVATAYNTLSSYMNVSVVGWGEENFPTEIGR